MVLKEEIKLRKELWWVYQNILENFGNWDKKKIKKRCNELRYFKLNSQEV